jgi:hypothetical protein
MGLVGDLHKFGIFWYGIRYAGLRDEQKLALLTRFAVASMAIQI